MDLRPAAELLGGWPEIQPVCLSINAVPALKGLKELYSARKILSRDLNMTTMFMLRMFRPRPESS